MFIRLIGVSAAAASVVLLAACGASRSPSPRATHRATPASTATASASPAGPASVDVGGVFNLDATQVQAAATPFLPPGAQLTQTGDGAFKGHADTSQRFFDTADHAVDVEVDVFAGATPSDAGSAYSSLLTYVSADLSQAAHSAPAIGNQADEYVGLAQSSSDNSILSVAAISFRQGATVGMVFWAAPRGTDVQEGGEAIARMLSQRVASVAFPSGPCGSSDCIARFEGTSDSIVAQFDVKSGGWYSINHYTYPVRDGAACTLTAWSERGPKGLMTEVDPSTALSIAQSSSGETQYLDAGHYQIDAGATQCFWRIVVMPTNSPFG